HEISPLSLHDALPIWTGAWAGGLTYTLQGAWIEGFAPLSGGRRTPSRELTLTLAYREPERHRHAVAGQYIERVYRHAGAGDLGENETRVGMLALDWAYRPGDGLGFSSKVAWKRELATWNTGSEGSGGSAGSGETFAYPSGAGLLQL